MDDLALVCCVCKNPMSCPNVCFLCERRIEDVDKGIPYFDRWDIVEAWHLYLTLNHYGMGSYEYRRLSKLMSYFKPAYSCNDYNDLSPNGQLIYDRLEREGV